MGERPSNPLESALAHLRSSYRTSPGNEESGWFARLEFEEQSLLEWADAEDRLGGSSELIAPGPADGAEHRVRFDEAQGRWFKATHPETYGMAPSLSYGFDERTGRPLVELVCGKATPLQYLERWALSNRHYSDDVRLERIIPAGHGLSILVSQRDITGEAPELEEIERYFADRAFIPVPGARDAYYRAADHILALDAHQANLVRTPAGLVPIDVPTFHPDRDVTQWLHRNGLLLAAPR
jgi:hypothetical protein